MINTIFAKKINMTGKFTDDGRRVGVTTLSVFPLKVLDQRTTEKHHYQSLRMQFHQGKKSSIREIRTVENINPGTEIVVDQILKPGDLVQISGISKGRGFAGVVKRYHFKGGPRTHGQSDRERAPGSSGPTTTPGRVLKGTRRSGHMGNVKITSHGQKIYSVDASLNQIQIIGSVPGRGNLHGELVTVTKLS